MGRSISGHGSARVSSLSSLSNTVYTSSPLNDTSTYVGTHWVLSQAAKEKLTFRIVAHTTVLKLHRDIGSFMAKHGISPSVKALKDTNRASRKYQGACV